MNNTSSTAIQSLYPTETEQVGWQYHMVTEETTEKYPSNEMSKLI